MKKVKILPINTRYADDSFYWVSNINIELDKHFSIRKGDKLYLEVTSPVHVKPDCANAYTLINETTQNSIKILNVIPVTCEGGTLEPLKKHYDAVLQIKNICKILSGKHETRLQEHERRIQIISETIPDNSLYLAKPRNSRYGHEFCLVELKDGIYRRLSSTEYKTAESLNEILVANGNKGNYTHEGAESFNVWGEYENKLDLAWHIFHNACVIVPYKLVENEEETDKLWSIEHDKEIAESIKRYKELKK